MAASAMTLPADDGTVRARLSNVDLVRGLVMVVMALDHTRDFFYRGAAQGDPELLADPGLALFLTRWITHFCAPAFVFLAGTGAFLSLGRGRTTTQLSAFLASRGLWLILLEVTLVKFGFFRTFSLQFTVFQVIWALGASMLVLAVLVHLPLRVIAAFGAVLVFGHNALDGVHVAGTGFMADVWRVLHEPGTLAFGRAPAEGVNLFDQGTRDGPWQLYIRYPLIPWIGVMALGYAFGAMLQRPEMARRRIIWQLGGGAVVAFLLLRAFNIYGDARQFAVGSGAPQTLISFLNTQKYPPSLLYLLMTLGPTLLLLNVVEHAKGWWAQAFIIFGRVPLFYYLLHLPLINLLVLPAAMLKYGPGIVEQLASGAPPADWGWDLSGTYLAWLAVVALLYPLCRWFAGVKARRRDWWLSYL